MLYWVYLLSDEKCLNRSYLITNFSEYQVKDSSMVKMRHLSKVAVN